MTDFAVWVETHVQLTESTLDALLPAAHLAPVRLHEAMRYATLGGGKRIRPLLAFAAGEAAGAPAAWVGRVAAAVECLHVYSLVHDDLPAMDDDELRRGKPTVHVAFDEATALLVGDALQSLAFEILAGHLPDCPAETRVDLVRTLAQAAGSRGMAGGQAIDLESIGRTLDVAELEFMHIHKTGALIRAAVLMGAACGQPDPAIRTALDHYARHIGLAFQVIDDVLDAETPTQVLGKTAGKDAAQHKPTYASLMGTARARALAHTLRDEALAALATVPRSAPLAALARMVVDRGH